MYPTTTKKDKLLLLLKILGPILVTQICMSLMNFFDTVMSGRVGTVDLAGVAIGSSLWLPIFTGINGILLAITPIVSHLLGEKDSLRISKKVLQAIYISITLAILIILIGAVLLHPILQAMDLEASVRRIAYYYLVALGTGIIPLFVFNTLRSFIDALGQTRVSMFIIILSLPINLVLNYLFIFGKLGIPTLGGIGAGIATALTYWLVALIAIGIVMKVHPFNTYKIFSKWKTFNKSDWIEQLKIGVPIGFAIFFETSIFSAVTILLSVFSTITIAAHQAAMNAYSLLYMIPLSVGMALTIVISYELGAKRFDDAKQYAHIGISLGGLIAVFVGVILWLFSDSVAKLYNSNPEVINLTTKFLLFAIILQLADAFGAPLQGILRGYKDVNVTLIMALISFWVIGLPTGFVLANYTALGPFGYWIGLIFGLSVGTTTLFFRYYYIQKQYQKRA